MLGLVAEVPKKPETLQFYLDHEVGHIGDSLILAEQIPGAGKLLAKGISTVEDMKSMISFFTALVAQKIPPPDQYKFRELGGMFFKEVESSTDPRRWAYIFREVAELFRYGEEIGDPRLEALFDETSPTLKKGSLEANGGKNPGVQRDREIKVARLLEAGLLEKFKKRPDFDPNTVNDLNPDHILFFRMFIRAASLYFYSPRVWQSLP